MSDELIPPDLQQCQAEKYTPFQMGGNLYTRCKEKPVYIATENKPGEDGRTGSMSLCEYCAGKLKEKMGEDFATLLRIKEVKA